MIQIDKSEEMKRNEIHVEWDEEEHAKMPTFSKYLKQDWLFCANV